jgi:hypothetical protein
MDHANAVLGDMVDEGAILAEERARMALASYPRRQSDLLAPFARDGRFQQLVVEDCQFLVLEDAAWADYEQDGDKDALAAKHSLFFRSVFAPSLASVLRRAGDPEADGAFGDRLEKGLKLRLAKQPAPVRSYVSAIVVAKQSPA